MSPWSCDGSLSASAHSRDAKHTEDSDERQSMQNRKRWHRRCCSSPNRELPHYNRRSGHQAVCDSELVQAGRKKPYRNGLGCRRGRHPA